MEDSGIDSDAKNPPVNVESSQFQGNTSDSSSSSNIVLEFVKSNNTRQLQRKIEQKIQEAKNFQKNQQQEQKKTSSGPNLIPIQRLSIPVKSTNVVSKEHLPLVDWDTEDSDEDVHFFSIKPPVKQELTDTFSIEEYQVSPEEDDLNLLPPLPTYQRFSFCCFSINPKYSIL